MYLYTIAQNESHFFEICTTYNKYRADKQKKSRLL